MNNVTFKLVLKFWQEIVFVVSILLLLIEIIGSVTLRQTMDRWDVFLVCWILPLLICLIGQLFWKNKAVAITLSILLGLSSVIVVCMAFYGIINSPSYRIESIAMLIIGIVSVIAALKMSTKYTPSYPQN